MNGRMTDGAAAIGLLWWLIVYLVNTKISHQKNQTAVQQNAERPTITEMVVCS